MCTRDSQPACDFRILCWYSRPTEQSKFLSAHAVSTRRRERTKDVPVFRGLHSSTLWLNVSAFCRIGGAFRSCLGGVQEVLQGIRGCSGVYFVSGTAQVELKSGRV